MKFWLFVNETATKTTQKKERHFKVYIQSLTIDQRLSNISSSSFTYFPIVVTNHTIYPLFVERDLPNMTYKQVLP